METECLARQQANLGVDGLDQGVREADVERIRAALAEYASGRALRTQAADWGQERLGP
jgi:hypothetical protein